MKVPFKEAELLPLLQKMLEDPVAAVEVKFSALGLICSLAQSGTATGEIMRQCFSTTVYSEPIVQLCGFVEREIVLVGSAPCRCLGGTFVFSLLVLLVQV